MHRKIEQKFSVQYSFPVLFTRSVFDEKNLLLAELFKRAGLQKHRVLVFIDSGVLQTNPSVDEQLQRYVKSHSEVMELACPPSAINGGEQAKNDPAVIIPVHEQIIKYHLCRQSFVLAIGGGAVLDAVGYAAATAHRGLRLIRIPTTVLAQNDAGVGVKNSINGYGRKNFLGTFAPPFAVINDFLFLNSLQKRDLRAGIVEAIKVALIKDEHFFNTLYLDRKELADFAKKPMEKMIFRCAELHLEHIASHGDPFEFDSSRPLDFGHWAAHKLEEMTKGDISHGEAVAVGIALDSLYSWQCGLLSHDNLEKILTILEDLGLKLFHPVINHLDVQLALSEFREHLGGELTITMLTGLGHVNELHEIDSNIMHHCIRLLTARHHSRNERLKNHLKNGQSSLLLSAGTDSNKSLSLKSVAMGSGHN